MYDRHVWPPAQDRRNGAPRDWRTTRGIEGEHAGIRRSIEILLDRERRKVILDRASFTVDLGYSLGILAPNGTGKTTLIRMMAGLEKPDEGQIYRNCRISFPLGFMGGVIGKLSGTENARYIAQLYGLDPDYVEAFCRWVCGIEEYFDMPHRHLFVGHARPVQLLAAAGAGIRHLPDRRGHARLHRRRVQPPRGQHPGRTHSQRDGCHRLAPDADTGKIRAQGRGAAGRTAPQFDTLEEAKQLYDYETQG
jgi:capsular polysaccharide transport system ATP-binding protein